MNKAELEYIQYKVNADNASIRLDRGLSNLNSELSRNQIQKLIRENYILVNDKEAKAAQILNVDDVITMYLKPLADSEIIPEDIPLDIIYEDNDLAIINKRQGMVVHPSIGHHQGTLVNAILYHLGDLSGINGKIRPGIVHRLDKDTSGLIIVCKNDNAHRKIADQLKDKTCSRKYLAIVHGVIPHHSLKVDAPIGRHPTSRQQMCVIANGKAAITHCTVIKRYADFTLVECQLETGRTHQIRVHLNYIKYPIAGDPLYGPSKTIPGHGQYLHAHEITFIHPTTNEEMTIRCDVPDYFQEVIAKLEQYGTVEVVKNEK